MVVPFRDVVTLDGEVVLGWEEMNALRAGDDGDDLLKTASFEYVKYFKPLGVTCTTDSSVEGNIIDSIRRDRYRPRHCVYSVGRLDKETTGLIVLTSDGRMVNGVLRGERKQPKVYKVMVNGRLEDDDLQRLRVSCRFQLASVRPPLQSCADRRQQSHPESDRTRPADRRTASSSAPWRSGRGGARRRARWSPAPSRAGWSGWDPVAAK